jgi:hypothetical protein
MLLISTSKNMLKMLQSLRLFESLLFGRRRRHALSSLLSLYFCPPTNYNQSCSNTSASYIAAVTKEKEEERKIKEKKPLFQCSCKKIPYPVSQGGQVSIIKILKNNY